MYMTYIPVQHSHCVSRTVDVKVVAIFVRLHQSPAVGLHAARGPRGHAARAGAASRRRGRVAGVAVACFSLLAPRTLSLLAILAVSPLALRRESEGRFQCAPASVCVCVCVFVCACMYACVSAQCVHSMCALSTIAIPIY